MNFLKSATRSSASCVWGSSTVADTPFNFPNQALRLAALGLKHARNAEMKTQGTGWQTPVSRDYGKGNGCYVAIARLAADADYGKGSAQEHLA